MPAIPAPADDSPPVSDDDFIRDVLGRYGNDLRHYAIRLCGGNRDRAEDLVQETILRAWRYGGPDSGRARTVRSWLMTIARNTAIDDSRARWSRPPESGPEPLGRMAAASAEEQVLDSAVVKQALAVLDTEHRNVIVCVYFQGLSGAETAAALGIPAGTVKSRTHYALRRLRQILADQGISWDMRSAA